MRRLTQRQAAKIIRGRFPTATHIHYSLDDDDFVVWSIEAADGTAVWDSNTADESDWPELAATVQTLAPVARRGPQRGDGLRMRVL